MSHERGLQLQRMELKYIVSENVALGVRSFIRSFLEIDEFGTGHPDFSYPVHSLYLDSDDLALYWQTINGNPDRLKLRLRFYEDAEEAPVYLEIKQRRNAAILKQRAGVHRAAIPKILAGQLADSSDLVSRDSRELDAVQRFSTLMINHRCKPKAHIAFLREAWVHRRDNSIRVTMDRRIHCEPETAARFDTRMMAPESVFGREVVLELKFTDRFPAWFGELVRVFSLRQNSAAKYADGVVLIGEERFNRHQVERQRFCRDDREGCRADFLQGTRLASRSSRKDSA